MYPHKTARLLMKISLQSLDMSSGNLCSVWAEVLQGNFRTFGYAINIFPTSGNCLYTEYAEISIHFAISCTLDFNHRS
jgi:hypothetical protein